MVGQVPCDILEVSGADATFMHNPEWSSELMDYAVKKSDMVVTDLTPGSVAGIVKDGDGKAVSGAEIRMGEDVWATTGADGSFEFDIAPGDHDFDVYKGTKKEKSFTATGVASGETTDVETIKFKAEDDSPGVGVIIALLAVTLMTLWMLSDRRN